MTTASLRPAPAPRRSPGPGLVFYAAVVLAGANMRTVFASLPPLLEDVRDDLGLSAAAAGLLTAVPIFCFGLLAPLAPGLIRRIPIERVVAICALLTAVGAAARGVGGTVGLYAGTALAGAAVAVAQTSLPTLLRLRFPLHGGALTGAFSMALTLGAALAAGLAVPLERLLGDSWQAALASFAIPAAVAAALWLTPATGGRTVVPRAQPFGIRNLARSWSLGVFFGLQSAVFYAALTWLPAILADAGYSEVTAGGLLGLTSAVQVLPALVVPVLAARRHDQRVVLASIVATVALGFVGLLAAPGAAVLWVTVIGIGQGGSLGLALTLPLLRGAGGAAVAALMALMLSLGYLISSIAPPLIGLAHDASGGWTLPLVLLIAITLAELVPGLKAAAAWTIGERDLEPHPR